MLITGYKMDAKTLNGEQHRRRRSSGAHPASGPTGQGDQRRSSVSTRGQDEKRRSSVLNRTHEEQRRSSAGSRPGHEDQRRLSAVSARGQDEQRRSSVVNRTQEDQRRPSAGNRISYEEQTTRRRSEDRKKKEIAYLGMFKAKVLVLGPCESGKTVISNFLSDATETSGGEYHPTQGVRILEFECNGIEISLGKTANCEVELWDCSGNHKFSTCWPAFQKDANGVVIVYNPDEANHDKELETWYSQFVQGQNLKDSQCIVFAHHRPSAADLTRTQLPSSLSRVTCVQTNLDEEPEAVRDEFHNFLAKVISNWTDKRDQEELSIMNT